MERFKHNEDGSLQLRCGVESRDTNALHQLVADVAGYPVAVVKADDGEYFDVKLSTSDLWQLAERVRSALEPIMPPILADGDVLMRDIVLAEVKGTVPVTEALGECSVFQRFFSPDELWRILEAVMHRFVFSRRVELMALQSAVNRRAQQILETLNKRPTDAGQAQHQGVLVAQGLREIIKMTSQEGAGHG